jgi:formate hydrogenlyase subunit 7
LHLLPALPFWESIDGPLGRRFRMDPTAGGEEKFRAAARCVYAVLHIMVVDAGDCGAVCMRSSSSTMRSTTFIVSGCFFTATPRTADVLLVVGPVSENMREPLLKTYDAMPQPKRVVAVGACAISGGVFGRTFASAGGVGMVLPVDLEIPGNPPPPLAIVHGLLVVTGRKEVLTKGGTSLI